MTKIKLLLADDHALILEGLIALLEREPDLEIAGTAANDKQVMEFLEENSVDACILDLNMPLMNGIDTVKAIRDRKISSRIIILTTHDEIAFINEMKALGVDGYVLKNSTTAELVTAVREVMKGESYFSRPVQNKIIRDSDQRRLQEEKIKELGLTEREIEVIKLLVQGLSNKEIADQLFISYRTVETHRKNIMAKTESKNIAGLISLSRSTGLT